MEPELGAGEDPSRFACSKLTGAPFYDRGRSESGGRPARAAAGDCRGSSGGRADIAHTKPKEGKFRQKSKI